MSIISDDLLDLEANPWTPKADLRDALLCRGLVVSAWGYVETTLIDIAIRSSKVAPYEGIRSKYPRMIGERIEYLRAVAALEGPLSTVAGDLADLVDGYEEAAEIRHLMAHAWMRVLGNWGATFKDFKPDKDGVILSRERRFTLDELSTIAVSTTALSRMAQQLMEEIDAKGLLPSAE